MLANLIVNTRLQSIIQSSNGNNLAHAEIIKPCIIHKWNSSELYEDLSTDLVFRQVSFTIYILVHAMSVYA